MSEIEDAVEEGRLLGAFAAGTGVWPLPAFFIAGTGALSADKLTALRCARL